MVSQQRAVTGLGKPLLESRQIRRGQQVVPLGGRQGAAISAAGIAHRGGRRPYADEPRGVGHRRSIALQLDQLPQAGLLALLGGLGCHSDQRPVAVLLHQRFRLGGQAAVRLSVGQRGQNLSPGRTLYRSQKALQIGSFGQRVQINAAALLQKVRQAVQVIAGAACIQAPQGGGQLVDLATKR